MTKKAPAAPSLVQQVEKLFDLAAKSTATPLKLKAKLSVDKLFELRVLGRILRSYSKVPGAVVRHVPPTTKGASANTIVVALNPASADRKRFSHFSLIDPGGNHLEAWVSVETMTLSWSIQQPHPVPLAALHELDVAVFRGGIPKYPSHLDVCLAVSCKNVFKAQKECVREVLGMRRETAFVTRREGGV
ncbi:hypothetical protein [Cupriavidus sp. UYPR2.512]|uniref:hypothetical protein n=1 Tax=Cupriavidus sp. UYPR2.512 TaxID=1080187 RepID=UPI00037A8C9E|nr:hypothetical protein [Cupriavidus sp. UYPR2.512]